MPPPGGDLFSYLDGTDFAVFSQFAARQNATIRQHSVSTCAGYGGYFASGVITAMVRAQQRLPAAAPPFGSLQLDCCHVLKCQDPCGCPRQVWTGLRSRDGSSTCGVNCVWQVRTPRARLIDPKGGAALTQQHMPAARLPWPLTTPAPATSQDVRTGNLVTDVASIKPCAMSGDGNAVEFNMRR